MHSSPQRYESHSDEFTQREPIGQVASLVEYLQLVEKSRPDGKGFFRGQQRSWTLRPGIDRLREPYEAAVDRYPIPNDRDLLNEFKRLSWPLFDKSPDIADDWAWMALAQHHGLPTRLIDWSTSSMIALWFAVSGVDSMNHKLEVGDTGPCVWMLRVASDLWIDSSSSPFDSKGLRVFEPPIVTPRLRAQRGAFTISGFEDYRGSIENIARNIGNSNWVYLEYVTIEVDACTNIADDLRKQGIDESAIYPDLEGTSAFLRRVAPFYANARDPWRSE